jgi:hypothetical protein
MDSLEQENQTLREKMTSMRAEMEKMTTLLSAMTVAQTQTSAPQLTNTSRVQTVSSDMPHNYIEGFHFSTSGPPTSIVPHARVIPQATMLVPPPIMTLPTPVVHTAPHVSEPIYHEKPTENTGACNRADALQDQYEKMQLEIKALRGKNLFDKNVHDLCLVSNVKIPPKFKVPEFEKYKGNSCPQSHLVMYARKMSTHIDNHQLLIHCFQDSLTGAALRWYTGLSNANIRTFNDLSEAFISQYKYNLDMAPDRDQLRAMAQKDRESFKEYAQRWREVAAQIIPPLEEKQMTKIFLQTLDSFYYKKMVASAPHDFADMVTIGMRLEEGVRQGRLAKKDGSFSGTRKLGNNFQEKEQEVSMLTQRGPKRGNYQQRHVVADNSRHLPRQRASPHSDKQNHSPRTPHFEPIPVSYAKFLPALIENNLTQTRPPNPVPEKFPWWYRSDHFCDFHQGAPGHDTEECWALKYEVQRLVRENMLSFQGSGPNV